MGFFNFKSTTPAPAEVSPKTVQFCVYAILAVAAADAMECLTRLCWAFLGRETFHFADIVILFWIIAEHALLIGCSALLAYLIHKRWRDVAVAAAGFCLARVAVGAVPTFESVTHVATNAASALYAFGSMLVFAASAGALLAIAMLVRRWPTK